MTGAGFTSLAAGRKVYRGGSHAPTRGRVNPKGYIKREVRNKSKKRSGLAKKAMQRKKAAKNRLKHGHGKPLPKKKPLPKRAPIIRDKPLPRPTPRPSKPGTTVIPSTPKAPAAPANPYVSINSNGQLDLPYNAQFSWDVLQNTQDMNSQLLDLQTQQQAQQQQYIAGGRDLDAQNVMGQRDILNQDAGRGRAYTSVHGANVANQATQYNNARSDLDIQNSQYNQGVQMQRSQIETNYNDMLRQSALANAEAQAKNAGTLGFGKAVAKAPAAPKIVRPKDNRTWAQKYPAKAALQKKKSAAAKAKAAAKNKHKKHPKGKSKSQFKHAIKKATQHKIKKYIR